MELCKVLCNSSTRELRQVTYRKQNKRRSGSRAMLIACMLSLKLCVPSSSTSSGSHTSFEPTKVTFDGIPPRKNQFTRHLRICLRLACPNPLHWPVLSALHLHMPTLALDSHHLWRTRTPPSNGDKTQACIFVEDDSPGQDKCECEDRSDSRTQCVLLCG